MIQNIEPHVYRNEYVPEPPKEDSVILYYEGRKILVKIEDQEISFLTFKEAAVYNPYMKSIRISFQLTDRDIIWQKELIRRISQNLN